jgi:hypothetical protein
VVEKTVDDIDARVLNGLEQGGLSLTTLQIGISAVVEDEVDELLGRLLVDSAAEECLARSGQLIRITAINKKQVSKVDLVGDTSSSKGSLVILTHSEARISAVLEERNGTSEERLLHGGKERCYTIAISAVGISTEEEEKTNGLGVAVENSFLKSEMLGTSVGRYTTIQQLFDEFVVPAAHGGEESGLEVGCVGADGVSRVPAGHAEGIGLESHDLCATVEIKTRKLLERGFTI